MRRVASLLLIFAALAGAPEAAAGRSWAQPQIRTVVAAGLMAPNVSAFRPDDALTRRELGQVLATVTRQQQVVVDPQRAVTVRELDAALVRAVGLGATARAVAQKLSAAGLRPPARAGTETVARLLELRYNHPAGSDGRELRPGDPATRAETAYSLARLLELSEDDLSSVQERVDAWTLPRPAEWQRRVLARAVRFVGFPYVWGGTSERPHAPFGVRTRGGFDCSGFVWRVYKLERFAGAPQLAETLRGRTTYAMSGEMRRADRIVATQLAPGDVVFFGARGPRSQPSEVGHMGIYVGGGWFVHSSGNGTTLVPLSGWYADSFAWGRRPLREAGLA
ncbi:MAG TPA: NlpC/P60 family protein [Gaiellaceae bacterium]|nr:NlpC/P60 family protein [Gaiellaceae bacterium]